ncbi:DUF4384 domain-containing protein [Pseudophaeobacter sp.]|uniref:DUF4384 domain-containing protein n=1 Tax=Pseudophaeobacter sp. TaxID=1971739 RepID=UPI00329A1A20
MTRGAGIWAIGLTASTCAHLGAAALVIPYLTPEPVPQQPSPQSAMTLASQQVTRSQAQEQSATPEPGKQAPAKGDSLNAGAVQQTTAPAKAPSQDSLDPATPASQPLTSLAPPGETLAPDQSKPQLAALSAAKPEPAPALAPATQSVASEQPDPPALETAMPDTTPAAPITPQPVLLGTTKSTGKTVAFAETSALTQPLPNSNPEAEKVTAALAFQGGATNEIDPQSLAAFQSFTRPGDLTGQTAGLRDGLAAVLSQVPCSRLQVAFDPATATLELRGHLPEDALRAPVLAALQTQMGRDIALADKMRVLPRPQCGALSGISSVGLPQSTDQITNPLLLGEDAQARVLGYSSGEQLYFDLTAPDYAAFIYVDYFDAAGDVIHLSPNTQVPLALATAKSAQRIGAKTPEDPGLQITIGPPYGQEIAVAFAASTPLYEGLRPLIEPAPAYLDFLRSRIAEKRSQNTDFKGEWVYFLIETRAQ